MGIKNYQNSIYYKNTLVPEKNLYDEKGRMGEYLVTNSLPELADNNGLVGYVYNNMLLELPNGSVSEIDIVFLSRLGIHCIEVKDRGGKVFGDFTGEFWDHQIGEESYRVYNPVLQNLTHMNYLAYYLKDAISRSGKGDWSLAKIFRSMVNVVVYSGDLKWFIGNVRYATPYFMGCLNSYKSTRFQELLTEEDVELLRPLLVPVSTKTGKEVTDIVLKTKGKDIRREARYFIAEDGSCSVPGALCMEDSNGYTYLYNRYDGLFRSTLEYSKPAHPSKRCSSVDDILQPDFL